MKEAASTKILFLFFLAGSLLGFLPGSSPAAMAQLRLIPLEPSPAQAPGSKQAAGGQMRHYSSHESLRLPFWDDFSFTKSVPDSSLWQNSEHIAVTNTVAVNPPSYNTATFDGIDAFGQPYSQDPNESGEADSLVSHPINLGSEELSAAAQASVYLSFYWQLQGRGNRPDPEDSLKLYFLDDQSVWHAVWREGGRQEIDSAAFKQEIISLQQTGNTLGVNFFHDEFRFKLASHNRRSGMYDLWHVDYIYLDKDRNSSNIYYQDRSISAIPSSLFSPYTALPIDQYFAAPHKYTSPEFSFTAFSLEQPGKYEPVNYSIVTLHKNDTVYELAQKRPFQSLLEGQQYFDVVNPGIDPSSLRAYRQDRDSLYLSTLVKLFSEEALPFFNHNDTARIENVLHDYFAFDDGSAEYGMEVRGGRGVRIAVEFSLELRDTLTHLDLYLPYFRQSAGGQYVDIKIWKRLADEENEQTDSLLYTERDVMLANSPGLNQFISYPLRFAQKLEPGTFYIGIEKRSDRFLVLGFDRNTDSRDHVYVSTDGFSWHHGMEDAGSLMLRPRFEQGVSPDVLSSREPAYSYPVNLYPNPSNGSFRVVSEARLLQVYNSQGQLLKTVEPAPGSFESFIDLRGHSGGLYIVKLHFKDAIISKKILIKP
jgi:hypothetical protein